MLQLDLVRSVSKYLNGKLESSGELYFDGISQVKSQTYPRFEVRYDGPTKVQYTKTNFMYKIGVSILVVTKDEVDRYKHTKLCEIVQSALEGDIPISDSNGLVIDCLRFESTIETIHFGQTDDTSDLIQSIVERDFSITV